MIFDTHVHTNFSSDSKMLLPDALARAKEVGMGLITTEHMDLLYPESGQFIFDVDQYFADYEQYRSEQLLLGIEVGMQLECLEENAKIVKKNNFDYVLGSIHLVDGIDIYYDVFYEKRTKLETYARYFEAMASCVKEHSFIDALGHIDYIARYAKYEDTEIYYHEFQENIDDILKYTIKNDIVLELNTRRFGDRTVIKALTPIYKRYYELGGRFATIGSDAHNQKDIGSHFKLAREFVEQCHLQLVYFKSRSPEYMVEK